MLDGQIDVGTEFFFGGQKVDEVVTPTGGIGVEHSDPVKVVNFGEFFEQVNEAGFAVCVGAVAHGVLGDEGNLFDAIGSHAVGFGNEAVDVFALVVAAKTGNGAKGAGAVAAVGDA